MLLLDCTVPGEPVSWARPRATTAGPGGHPRFFTADAQAGWTNAAAERMASGWRHAPMARDVPVSVEIEAVFHRPDRLMPTKGGKARADAGRLPAPVRKDADNISKLANDALMAAGVLEDDASIWRLLIVKEYAALGELPHVRVCVYSDVEPVARVAAPAPTWESRGTCEHLTGSYEKDDPERGLILVSVRHTCLRPACEARRWRIVRLPASRRPVDGDRLVTFAPGEVVR